LLSFLRDWSPGRYDDLPYAEDMLDQNVVFRLEGETGFIHDRPAARAALIAESGARDAVREAMCLVTGEIAPIARLHPSIKGVPGAQTAGASLVSFNLDSFTSYGHSQGANAPVSEAAAFAYATALNGLLTASGTTAKGLRIYRNRVMLGETTVPFWAEHGDAERIMHAVLAGDDEAIGFDETPTADETTESTKLRDVMSRLQDGTPPREIGRDFDPDTRVYVLGLSPNAARLSVRFWVELSLGDFTRHFQQILGGSEARAPAPPLAAAGRWLLREVAAQRDFENIPEHLGGEVMRAILTGLPYPRALLIQTILRIRADGDVNALRVAIVKAVITCAARRQQEIRFRQNPDVALWKDSLVALDRDEPNVGYRLGRLFALLDYAQYLSVGSVNAGIKEKFFASASSTPRHIFPSLLRMYQNHLSDARKSIETRDRANGTDIEVKQVMDGLEARMPFPTTLSIDDQGRFIVGFYHQRPRASTKKTPDVANTSSKENPTND
jgi:CRISPR-associated protein Csd1